MTDGFKYEVMKSHLVYGPVTLLLIYVANLLAAINLGLEQDGNFFSVVLSGVFDTLLKLIYLWFLALPVIFLVGVFYTLIFHGLDLLGMCPGRIVMASSLILFICVLFPSLVYWEYVTWPALVLVAVGECGRYAFLRKAIASAYRPFSLLGEVGESSAEE